MRTDPLIIAVIDLARQKMAANALRALELHDSPGANERHSVADEALRMRGLIDTLSSEAGAEEALRALRREPVSPTFAAPWSTDRTKRPGFVYRGDVELARGFFAVPHSKPEELRGDVAVVKLASGALELQIGAGFGLSEASDDREQVRTFGPESTAFSARERPMRPIFSSRADLGAGPSDQDVSLAPLRDRYGAQRVAVPEGIDLASLRFLHIHNGLRSRLVAELRHNASAKPAAPLLADVIEYDDSDEDAA